jgi:hypothetical protein
MSLAVETKGRKMAKAGEIGAVHEPSGQLGALLKRPSRGGGASRSRPIALASAMVLPEQSPTPVSLGSSFIAPKRIGLTMFAYVLNSDRKAM